MNDLISVIIPIYGVEKYLSQCIETVISQTYKNIEIVLVDDGSKDRCPKICDEYANKDDRVIVIHKKNGGLSDARNAGIKVAKGKYITFIDSDDYIAFNYIEYLYELIIKNNADMSVCQRNDVNENGIEIGAKKKYKDYLIENTFMAMSFLFTKDELDTVAWGKLYKTSMFNDVEYPYGKYHEDVFTTYRLIAKCKRVAIGAGELYYYRHRYESIQTQSFSKKHLDGVEGNIERYNYICEYFPQLKKYAAAGIIYAANQCVLKMRKSQNKDEESIKYLQDKYRKYEIYYLQGVSSFKAKLFSIIAFVNIAILL